MLGFEGEFMTEKRDDLKKPTPQSLARGLISQRADVSGMGSIAGEVDVVGPYEMPMKDFVTKILPQLRGGSAKFNELYDAIMKEIDTKVDHNAEVQLGAYMEHTSPFTQMWKGIEAIAQNRKPDRQQRAALDGATALLGQLVADRKGAIEDHRENISKPEWMDEVASARARFRALQAAILAGNIHQKPSEKPKPMGEDYAFAKQQVDAELADMSSNDNSPDVLMKLQSDIRALNKARGEGRRPGS